MARRVSESTTSSTCRPRAQKYSAMVVAARPARMRRSGSWSEVETTTTERRRPSSPSALRSSPTSRPRSPIRPKTVRSALVLRAIMPMSVLLPTPLPPKMPTRWPRPQVRKASPNDDLVAITDAGRAVQGHGENGVAAEADNLSRPATATRIDDFAGLADGAEGAFGFDDLADDLYHSAAPAQGGRVLEVGEVGGEDMRRCCVEAGLCPACTGRSPVPTVIGH